MDGADFINSNTGVQRATPPQESVSEFRVVNNSFGSEYGRALGGIVNVVTKSGTNELHGSIYDYLQNSAVDSRSLLQPKPAPFLLRQNQFGGTLGGPIRKDKTFFFMNYEGQRRGEAPVLPPDFRSNVAAINQAKAYLGIPSENPNPLKTKDNDYGFVRIDHQLSNRHRLSVRYNVEDARDLNQLVGNTEDGGALGLHRPRRAVGQEFIHWPAAAFLGSACFPCFSNDRAYEARFRLRCLQRAQPAERGRGV